MPHFVRTTFLTVVIAAVSMAQTLYAAKNVIVMVADGSGFNSWDATSMYQGRWDPARKSSTQVYDGPGWMRYSCSTFPLNTSKAPAKRGMQDPKLIYDPTKAWGNLKAYDWLKSEYTDSAAAATALATGQKTFNNALNWSDLDQPIRPTLAEAAYAVGKSAGVITTVPWSHATPAGLGDASIPSADQYAEIARQMMESDTMNVIMGAGNPDFDNNGQPARGRKDYKYVGGPEAWRAIEAARLSGATYHAFRPVSTKAEFEALLSGPAPARVLGTVQVRDTLQQARKGKNTADPATDTPLTKGLPDLATMSKAALNVLGANPKGFYLMIRGRGRGLGQPSKSSWPNDPGAGGLRSRS